MHLMMGLGSLMALIFCFIYFVPYKQMGAALEMQQLPVAGQKMAIIRRLIGVNLILGLVTTVIAGMKFV